MHILKNFASQTVLPVKIESVKEYILNQGIVDKIFFEDRDEDPNVIAGMLIMRKDTHPYAEGVIAYVIYSSRLEKDFQRLIAAKELIHICDSQAVRAKSRTEVDRLLTEINLPAAALVEVAKLSPQLVSDRTGFLMSLALLVPRAALKVIKKLHAAGRINHAQVAEIAEIPEMFVPIVMSNWFEKLSDKIMSTPR